MEYIPLAIGLLTSLFGGNSSSTKVVYQKDPQQEALIKQMRESLDSQMKQSQALKESFEINQKKLEQLQKEADSVTDPKEFSKNQSKYMDKFIEIVKDYKFPKREYNLEGRKPVIVIGPTSAGKSCLINAIADDKVAKMGMGETTIDISVVHSTDKLAFFDAPGENDKVKTFSFNTLAFLKMMKCVIVVYKDDPNCVINLIRICSALQVNIICVRNQVDNADESPEELKDVKKEDLRKITQEIIPSSTTFKGLFFLSARNKFQKKSDLFDWIEFTSTLVDVTSR